MTFEDLINCSLGSVNFWSSKPRGLRIQDIESFLDAGGDVNQPTASGDTLLHIATFNLQFEIVRFLLTRGADVNAKGYAGNTPLHLAVDSECNTQTRQNCTRATDLPLTQLLLDSGADEAARNDSGETARDFAIAYGEHETQLYDTIPRQQ